MPEDAGGHEKDKPMTAHQLPAKTPSGYRMVARGSRGEIFIYGPIGLSWLGDGVSASQFAKDLRALGNNIDTLDLRLNSEGGSVVDAEAIHTHLVEHKARVIRHVDGMAASAASFVLMAADEIVIADSGFVMIHEARMMEYGTAEDFRRGADLLDRTTDRIVAKYVRRTKNDEKKVREWMKAETWFIGEEAVKNGFADRVVENLKVAASVSDPSRYRNLPTALNPKFARVNDALARGGEASKRIAAILKR